MAKRLSDFLENIGKEIHDESYVDDGGIIRPITRDEQLARLIFKRALGYEEETTNADGVIMHRVYEPDPKAQQFIFERREGKFVTPIDDKSISLLERISEIAKNQANQMAEQVVEDDTDDTQSGA